MLSVNTNVGQMVALQSYRESAQALADAQNRVATGLAISSPKDNGAVFAIAQNMRALAKSYDVLRQANDRTLSLLDVSIAATQNISDLLIEMKQLALAATDSSLTAADRDAMNQQFLALKQQIDTVASSANYNGQNLIDSSGSNFVQYGPGAMPPGTSPVEWGNTPRTAGVPKAGEPMTLRFGFSGSGQQPEQVSGDVDFKLRYWDNGAWTIVPLASTTVPTVPPTQVGPNLPPYVAQANATMPTLPDGATDVQIYAEYLGPVPAPDGNPVSELDTHGDPSPSGAAESVPHLIASWGERGWQSVPAQPPGYWAVYPSNNATSNGTVSGNTDSQVLTEGGAPVITQGTVSGSLQLTAQPGVTHADFDYTTSYQVFDQSQNAWVTIASSAPQTWSAGTNTSLPYSMNIPAVPDANKDFSEARIVANIVTHDNGSAVASPTTNVAAGSSVTTSNASLSGPDVPLPLAVAPGFGPRPQVSADIQVHDSVSSETYSASANYVLRWYDGSGWREQAFGTTQSSGIVASGTPVNFSGSATIPSINGPMTQAQILARVQVTHDPLGTPMVESYDAPVMTWDGVTLTAHAAAMTVAVAGNGVQIYDGVRQVESTTKVDALSGIDGRSMPVRDKDSTTAGTAGLFLQTVTLDDEASATEALARVDAAQARIMRQTQYFASVHKAVSVQNDFEGKLIDQINIGIGNLVDADMAKEGAKLQAAQTRQQLNIAGLSISNNFPQLLLSLFRA